MFHVIPFLVSAPGCFDATAKPPEAGKVKRLLAPGGYLEVDKQNFKLKPSAANRETQNPLTRIKVNYQLDRSIS